MAAKRSKLDSITIPNVVDPRTKNFLGQFENEPSVKPTTSLLQEEINQTLHQLKESITYIQSCLEKTKTKRVNLNEINRKIDLILEILKQSTTS